MDHSFELRSETENRGGSMKKIWMMLLIGVSLLSLTACAGKETRNKENHTMEDETMVDETMTTIAVRIGDDPVTVEWEDNRSVNALMELAKDEPLTVQMSGYGGFEQVGSLGTSLPRDDVQTTTQAGDIVLYSGNQIVVFYGSNSWAYTRLGRITDKTEKELTKMLGNGDITLTLSVK